MNHVCHPCTPIARHARDIEAKGKTVLMPMGKFAGQPVESMRTAFLAWLISQDAIRHARPALVEHIVGVMAERFRDPENLLAELRVAEQPPTRWRSAKKARGRQVQDPYDVADLV